MVVRLPENNPSVLFLARALKDGYPLEPFELSINDDIYLMTSVLQKKRYSFYTLLIKGKSI